MHRRALSRTARIPIGRREVLLALACFAASACGDNDGLKPAADYAERCSTPRTGNDPFGDPWPDVAGTANDEKNWVRSWIDDTYLWYSEVPAIDLSKFATALDVFDQAKTFAKTMSGKDKDEFHFTMDTADWIGMSQGGVVAGYGVQWAFLATKPPRKLLVAYSQPGSPADTVGHLEHGAKVISIDGVDMQNGTDTKTLNAGLRPVTLNESHTFVVQDLNSTETRSITLTSTTTTLVPVQKVTTLSIPGTSDRIGYFLFIDHIASAEKGLVNAITQLKAAGITDLILDLRYNGGGYLDIASELAYMIAGPTRTSGKTFERLSFNDKHPTVDPVTGQAIKPSAFLSETAGFSLQTGQPLPHLDLPRVFVLTSADTCSASESVINSLAGVDVQVIQIGDTTCGKPYGFYPADNCGTTFFAIQFQGVNDKGFGDYADGFVPGGIFPGCVAGDSVNHITGDDFNHALGDPAEALVASALAYRANGACPAAATARSATARATGSVLDKPIWLQNRILGR